MKFELVLIVREAPDGACKSRDEINASSLISLLNQFLIVIQQLTEKLGNEQMAKWCREHEDDIPF